ncbi:MAG: 50S ribosomal protein L18 [Candidatus Undinarchaeales archaeon]|jgi:large subunit ribosomal protein L18|nr:50S ribosomal protein L18 [Candidatus Undinarchaeales archaeon]MDP7493951.1 50S ribosomal protein L18 [Candidatus Undinarchaeales archaeon]
MAKNAVYRVPFRRRREKRTDYRSRRILLQARKPRFVVRRSNKYISAQVVQFDSKGDLTLASATSQQLAKFGWDKGTKNLPAAYLTGYLIGKRAQAAKVKEGILDLGVVTSQRGGRLYATLKGILDSGVAIPHSDDIFPPEERINGQHIDEKLNTLVETTKNKIDKA